LQSEGYWGEFEVEVDKAEGSVKARSEGEGGIEKALKDNAEMVAELQGWQEVRVRRGDVSWTTEREQQVGESSAIS
jgi:hypothetical protein